MDDLSTPTLLTLACRYIPHDQWLLTHLNPTWKIRDVKMYILSKCLNTHFEPPAPTFPIAETRPRSPIVFADPHNRPISPIKFAAPKPSGGLDRGYDDEEDWDEDGYDSDDSGGGSISVHGGLVAKGGSSVPHRPHDSRATSQGRQSHQHHVRSSSSSSIGGYGSVSGHRVSNTGRPPSSHGHHPQSQSSSLQIPLQPRHFTLLRFSTCQILEDDFRLQDYELAPYELLEMHCSFPFPQPSQTKLKRPILKRLITPLPRSNIDAYIQPYWEGWVRVLRVVWRDDAEWYEYAMGNYPGLGGNTASGMVTADGAHREGESIDGRKGRIKLEWRERWVVVKDGMLLLCKDREDLSPARKYRLSSLAELRGAEYLATSTKLMQVRRSKYGTDYSNTAGGLSSSSRNSSFVGTERDRSNTPPVGDRDDRTYIPGSRDEADRAGLKIVCAKFWTSERRSSSDVVKDKSKENRPKYTNTGPSLSLLAGPLKASGEKKKSDRKGGGGIHTIAKPGKETTSKLKGKDKAKDREWESMQLPPQGAVRSISRVDPRNYDQHNKNQSPYLRKLEPSTMDKGKSKSGGGKLGSFFGGGRKSKKQQMSEAINVPLGGSTDAIMKATKSSKGKGKAGPPPSRPGSSDEGSIIRVDEDEDGYSDAITRPPLVNDEVTRINARSEEDGGESSSSGGHASEDEAASPGSASDSSLTLSSPVFAHTDTDDEDDGFFSDDVKPSNTRFGGYRYGYVPTRKGEKDREKEAEKKEEIFMDDSKRQLKEEPKGNVRNKKKRKESLWDSNKVEEKAEWAVLDLRDDNAYTSLLRILHRHFSNPINSSFVATLPTSSSPPSTPTSSENIFGLSKPSFVTSATSIVHTDRDHTLSGGHARETTSESNILEYPVVRNALTTQPITSSAFPSKTFGALPYPEWRIELVRRAQKAGLGDIGRAVEALRSGASGVMRPSSMFLDQMRTARHKESVMTEDSDSISGTSALTERPNRSLRSQSTRSVSDDEQDNASYMLSISDSEDEGSEAEWQAWMADLYRQVDVRTRARYLKPVGSSETLSTSQVDDDLEEKPPKTLEDDLFIAINRRRRLEPSGIVITSLPSSPVLSSEFSFADTPPRHPNHTTSQGHTTNRTLRQSVSMHAEQLHPEVSELSSGRRPSMPILTTEQTFALNKGMGTKPNMFIKELSAVLTAGNCQFPTTREDASTYTSGTTALSQHSSNPSSAISRDDTGCSMAGISTGPRRSNSAGVMHAPSTSEISSIGLPSHVKQESNDVRKTKRPQLSVATSSSRIHEPDVILPGGPDHAHAKLPKRKFMRKVRSGSSLKSGAEDPTSPIKETVVAVKKSKASLAHGVEKIMNRGVAALDSAMDFVDR